MRIAIIGKFPPTEGGVSARTYWTAHGLAQCGHEVHVITNAKETRTPFRMYMRPEDWQRCSATYGSGSVTIHWSDPEDRSQHYIPMASPFVSKLAAITAHVHSKRKFDVILSYYMEPYGIAGHLVAEMTGVPHVARMAGSDAGRLWRHPQLEPLYDHVLRSAEAVVAAGAVAERAATRGVLPHRIVFGGAYALPEDIFTPFGPVLDPAEVSAAVADDIELRDAAWGELPPGLPYFGVYGKLGPSKGSFALLAALDRLKRSGVDAGLLAMAHGSSSTDRDFRAKAVELGLSDRILQLPFLPNWRVPEFLRGCLAVCCLEQGFPIEFHAPIVPREVLQCGACLVGSAEVIRKLPNYPQLPDGYGCAAIADVGDVGALSAKLATIVCDPEPLLAVRARGCAFARALQRDFDFPQTIERVLEAAALRRPAASTTEEPSSDRCGFVATRLPETEITVGKLDYSGDGDDPLFRLRTRRWAIGDGALADLMPMRAPRLELIQLDFDAAADGLPPSNEPRQRRVGVFSRAAKGASGPFIVDQMTARLLQLCDGSRTAREIVRELDPAADEATMKRYFAWMEMLFRRALLWLRDTPPA